jgi:hypothetical protein
MTGLMMMIPDADTAGLATLMALKVMVCGEVTEGGL